MTSETSWNWYWVIDLWFALGLNYRKIIFQWKIEWLVLSGSTPQVLGSHFVCPRNGQPAPPWHRSVYRSEFSTLPTTNRETWKTTIWYMMFVEDIFLPGIYHFFFSRYLMIFDDICTMLGDMIWYISSGKSQPGRGAVHGTICWAAMDQLRLFSAESHGCWVG